MFDDDAIATLPATHPGQIIRSVKNQIGHAVPNSRYRSVCHRNHRNVLGYIAERSQTDIQPGMPVVGRLAAQRIQRAVPGIDVRHLLNETVLS